MRTLRPIRLLPMLGICLGGTIVRGFSQQYSDDVTNAFAPGREYFVLRSGNAKLILQSDKSGAHPAFTYMVFDADKPCQTEKKDRAFNYTPHNAWFSSALAVVLKGTPFTALGHTTQVQWRVQNGIPAVEARWWAGGIEVRESISALEGANVFLRRITLKGKDIAGPDTMRLRLSLPPGTFYTQRSTLVGITRNIAMGLGFLGGLPAAVNLKDGYIESFPLPVDPGSEISVNSLLTVRIPARGHLYESDCEYDRPIPSSQLFVRNSRAAIHGLTAHFFGNPDLLGDPIIVRPDTALSPYWDTASPDPRLRPDSFSVRWTGYLLAPRTGRYRFSLVADDKARLFVDGTRIIDCWENSWNVTRSAELECNAGQWLEVRVEFAELTGWAGMRLRWSIPPPPADKKNVEAGVQEIFAFLERAAGSQAVEQLEKTLTYWRQTSSIETTDSLVQRLYRNATFALPGFVGEYGRMDAGMFEYGAQWVRDGSNVALGLIHAGHFESARGILNYILSDLVSNDGATVIAGGYDALDREEFDQMGELMHALKTYYDWTDDSTLLISYRTKLLAMIERPLAPRFRDSTGMVHNRREYWERTFEDAYELAYQTLMVRGLRDAADLARQLGVPAKAQEWREEADRFLHAMISHPSRSLVEQGAFVKRRNVDGTIADRIAGPPYVSGKDDPISTEAFHRLNPDASYVLPICLRVVDPQSELSHRTLDKLEEIWNARWDFGGYERYHSSSQQDQPGPWCFATASIARAQHDAGLYERSRRSLEWLLNVQGGNAGTWFEEIPLIRSQVPTSGIVPWTSAEVALFAVRHWLGLSFEGHDLVVRPNLFPHQGACTADLRFRSSRIRLEIDKAGEVSYALVNGIKTLPRNDGSILIPPGVLSGAMQIRLLTKP